jgi:hypothetical protein
MPHLCRRPALAHTNIPRLYEATGDAQYLRDAEAFYARSAASERHVSPNPDAFDYENVMPALHLMLYKVGGVCVC